MITLNNWLNGTKYQMNIDGHLHIFSRGWKIEPDDFIYSKCVGFIDIEPKYIEDYKDTIKLYKDFINSHYNNVYLLAASTDQENMIEIHKKWPKIIKGFGEIKCYADWKGNKLNLDKLSKYWKLFKYAEDNNLPIWIHFSIYDNDRINRLEKVLNRFPNLKIVLCHCGMDEFTIDKSYTFMNVVGLMERHKNLFTDISYVGLDFFAQNPMQVLKLDTSRVILGSDLNKFNINDVIKRDNVKADLDLLSNYIDSDKNVKYILGI